MKIIHHLKNISQSRYYWLFYIVAGTALLAEALYFQFVVEEQPCLMCIQVRLLISLLILLAFAGLFLSSFRWINNLLQLSVVVIAGWLIERSYQLLGTERGFIFSDCGFELGLPAWFAIDEWLPWLYRVEAACGYTPEILFGITMAEALLVLSILLLLFSSSILLISLLKVRS